ncbi:MAG: hypothetical protein IIZ33_09710 [Erysipelotrichaceae bacterium]|nr:hypothetical protein [Erysipelotrichaceae bacterium]
MKRRYVDVICLNDTGGHLKPLYLLWEHDRKIPIYKIREICPCAALKAGGSGLRYTCLFAEDIVRHLYYDRGKWFVEMQDVR